MELTPTHPLLFILEQQATLFLPLLFHHLPSQFHLTLSVRDVQRVVFGGLLWGFFLSFGWQGFGGLVSRSILETGLAANSTLFGKFSLLLQFLLHFDASFKYSVHFVHSILEVLLFFGLPLLAGSLQMQSNGLV